MRDIFFRTGDYIFSYRVAGILVRDGKVLLHRPVNDDGYAFPGGHVSFGETNEETLVREFKEEIQTDIKSNGLRWVGEIFFYLEGRPCHQICLYYDVSLLDENQLSDGRPIFARDEVSGITLDLEFFWIDIARLSELKVYPDQVKALMQNYSPEIKHFIYKEW